MLRLKLDWEDVYWHPWPAKMFLNHLFLNLVCYRTQNGNLLMSFAFNCLVWISWSDASNAVVKKCRIWCSYICACNPRCCPLWFSNPLACASQKVGQTWMNVMVFLMMTLIIIHVCIELTKEMRYRMVFTYLFFCLLSECFYLYFIHELTEILRRLFVWSNPL